MSKFKFINIVDTLFLSTVTFLIIFVWVQFFAKNIALSLFVSIVISSAFLFTIKWFNNKKYNKKNSAINHSQNLILFKLALQTMPKPKLTNTIKKLLPATYQAKSNNGDITFIKDNSIHLITFCFEQNLSESKLLEIIRTKNCKNITIICPNTSPENDIIAKAFKDLTIKFLTFEQLFTIFNNKNVTLDTSNLDLTKHKVSIKEIFKNSLSRNKSKGYFISGLVLLFTSLIIPYKIYYVVFSSILFILSIYCRIKPKSKPTSTIFD